jgi:putative transposase
MKRRRFNAEQITGFLHQAELGVPIKDICRKHGFTEQTYYRWKRQYAGMGVSEVRELNEVRKENNRLKKLVADLTLDKHMLQEVLKKKF